MPRRKSPEVLSIDRNQSPIPTTDEFVEDVRSILEEARRKTYSAANTLMIESYWKIGQRIVQEEQGGKERAEYGAGLIANLARRLGNEFGNGVSVANLKNFRQFFLVFPDLGKGYALRSELTWTHYRILMRVENPAAREHYLHEAADQGWSSRQLERNITSLSYERMLATPAKPKRTASDHRPEEFIKDPYVLEFLGLPESPERNERKLETAIMNRLQRFLLEMGKGFSFVGRQFRISTETSHFFVDLVFYNYLLKCFVLIDLKTTKLTHQDIGQMDMYVRMFDDLKRGPDDNPTLGIILCADKDETVVRYSVLSESRQLFVSKYRLVLPSEEELRNELERRHVLTNSREEK
jgi:predicted nuclease of restriction endonuclease-like (RecB) superfamily